MNRKGTLEQNDISLIIGNLPKRLQRKIAENCNSVVDEQYTENELSTTQSKEWAEEPCTSNLGPLVQKGYHPDAESTTLSILRSKSAERKGEEDVSVTKLVMETSEHVSNPDEVVIPGIIRLNVADTAQIKQATEKANKNQHSRRRVKAQTRRINAINDHQFTMSPARVRLTTAHPPWFEQLLEISEGKELIQLYDQLMLLLQRNLILTNWINFCEIHAQLQQKFKKLLLDNLKFCCEQKIDNFFWKLLLYNIREYLKLQNSEESFNRILELIDQTSQFYEELFDKFTLKFLSSASAAYKYESISKVTAQRLLICLGDLSRYRTKQLQTNDYFQSMKYYQKAQTLLPTNGVPYNQMAIVSIHDRKRFDAVYYHMRSLLSSNAIYTAKESLLDLFEDIRKRYEETEQKQSPIHQHQKKSSRAMRKEVWIYPDGVRRLHRTDIKGSNRNKATVAEEIRFKEMSPEDLLRRVISLYLYIIGKLYTGIGMETIYHHSRKLFIQMHAALRHSNIFSRSKILKLVALNIFIMEHNICKESRREIRYHAFNFCNMIFGLVLKRANLIFGKAIASVDGVEGVPERDFSDLNTTLQFVKIYTLWLALNEHIWEPLRSDEHCFVDCWFELQVLFDNIKFIIKQQPIDVEDQLPNTLLDEDVFLLGFTPLGRSFPTNFDVKFSETFQFYFRIAKITTFQTIYEANRTALDMLNSSFELEELNSGMQDVLNTIVDNENDTSVDLDNDDYENENSKNVGNSMNQSDSMIEFGVSTTDAHAEISQLTKLKKELEAKTRVKTMYSAKLEEILKFVDTKLYIEVRPRYLLPDTNCFIDCLEDFENLVKEFMRYTFIVPLTVVKELDGLSKGVKLEIYDKSMQKQRIHHFDDVSTRAKKSLEFLKKAKNVKCATTKGSIINASLFSLVEEEHVSNDDKILATALALSKTMSVETCMDGKCLIQTELVLITTDRNLRVKALSRNLAVSEFEEFLQWAKDCERT